MDYATAGNLVATFGRAWETFDGDLVVSLFTETAEYHEDPFEPPLIGHNAIRAYWLDAAKSQDQVEFTTERHWVSGDTILAACHASYVERPSGDRVRMKAFFTFEGVLHVRDGERPHPPVPRVVARASNTGRANRGGQ